VGRLCPLHHRASSRARAFKGTYHDPRTQTLPPPLAQTPTGRSAVTYPLTIADRLSEGFVTWRDLGPEGNAGENNAGGYITLNTALLTRDDLGPFSLVGTLLDETVESYCDSEEGIRSMGTRHADYVAQWLTGIFARELRRIPSYTPQDPF
jgi:hypothetical protein